jgi:sugar phosphate permease
MANNQFNVAKANFGLKGWIMIIYMMLGFYINTSVNSGWQNMVTYWNKTYGWNATTMVSLVSIGQFIGIVVMFIVGRLAIRHSVKKLGLFWGILVTVGLYLVGIVRNYALMCVLELLIVLANTTWAFCINPNFVSSWFPRKKGIVMGLVTIGVPLGAGTTSKIMNFIGATWGTQYNMMFNAILATIALVILVFYVKDEPEQVGYNPDNDMSLTSEDVKRMAAEKHELDMKSPWNTVRMLKTKETWIIALCIGSNGLFGSAVMQTNVLHMLSRGYPIGTAVNMMIFTALSACVLSYLFGVLDAKKGPNFSMRCVFLCAIVSCVFNLFAANFVCLIIGLVLVGAVIGGAANFLTSLVIEYWGPHNFKRAYGVIYPIHQIPGSLGAIFMMSFTTKFGSYSAGYIALLILMIVMLALFFVIRSGDFVKKQEAKWKE